MALYESELVTTSFDNFFDSFKIMMTDVLGFVCASDSGSGNARVMIFSLAGHDHRIKFYWYQNVYWYLYSTILNTNHTDSVIVGKITNANTESPYTVHTTYRAISFNGLKSLFIIDGSTWYHVFTFTTAGDVNVIFSKIATINSHYLVSTCNTAYDTYYYMNVSTRGTGNKIIVGPYMVLDTSGSLVVPASVDGVYKNCSYDFGSTGMKIQIDDKKFVTAPFISTTKYTLIRYE